LAVDAGAALRREEKLQAAVDSAALAALRALPTQDDEGVRKAAQAYITTNFGGLPYSLDEVKIDRAAQKVELKASSPSDTMFGGIFGIDSMKVDVEAVAKGGGSIELVMALDNSGSMAEAGRMPALREASTNLVKALMEDPTLSNRVKIGVAPFSTAVNVGANHRNAGWIDTTGANDLNGKNVSGDRHNLQLFDQVGVAWKGCVESRTTQGGLDVNDSAPSSGSGQTLFVPMLAPDESDVGNYLNSYLLDDGGACNPSNDGSAVARNCGTASTRAERQDEPHQSPGSERLGCGTQREVREHPPAPADGPEGGGHREAGGHEA
jgi:Flp pilus assembly protein TadG